MNIDVRGNLLMVDGLSPILQSAIRRMGDTPSTPSRPTGDRHE